MKKILELTLIVAGAMALTFGCSQNAGDSANANGAQPGSGGDEEGDTEFISLEVKGMT